MADHSSIHGVVADFASPDTLLDAVKAARAQGYTRMEAYTPFPIHGIDEAMGAKPSILGYIVLCGSATGFTTAVLLQWWTGTIAYPLVISGKPLFAFEFGFPVMFELTVLLSAFAAVFGMLGLNGLPRLSHPIFNYSGVAGSSDDRFLLVIEASDKKFDANATKDFLASLGAEKLEVVEA
ncbi:MAG: DUF3341 domain-containing protein [Acidobacteriaceae bacterium]|jgi:hypothetical protein|nr:DUF3341 domain-containing protein [Acidobacteriaceae bacterium]